ncbi:nadph-dependent 1-acyldihydroxyacetone phosphate reductase protein [Purpureocillium lavendulum]|uniref:Nadph-dependent 1-acyldihydroxyacetone phosphate reductase protein n=1 Tax=Purpureocillium lavendulum TaxID=1247861 RepID=A0AB34FUC8_9HYPO|nr:nadph-dependent 1-acyldihydroxyacetone phosphate reductase protein [Purpureocillium lavendulum]
MRPPDTQPESVLPSSLASLTMSKQSVLITGCSDGGIGAALAVVFQQRGFHVFATTRDPSKMSSLRDLPDVTLLALDIVKSEDIKAAVQAVSDKTGGTLDCLISNAGRNHFMPILDEDLDTVRNIFEINLVGPMALTHAFAPLLIKAKGMAVYVTSISGYLNIPYMGTYSASKRGLEIVAETLRLELAPFGVDVLEVVTGGVKSQGQTYFGDLKLPPQSLYKDIEETVVSRAQGNDGMPRMDTMEYATSVVDEIVKRSTGRFWCGVHVDQVRMSTTATAVPQSAMDAGAVMGTGLDALSSKE